MDYKIIVANGESEEQIIIVDVDEVELLDEAYSFKGDNETLLFSAPTDSVKYVIRI